MASSQSHIPIESIKDNLVFLKDGSVSLVLVTSAVNFGLLFETEQISIIESFAGFLNSLSFPIQIVIRSKRLDVSSYLTTIDRALEKQKNQRLTEMTNYYRQFVESMIKEKNVLDKQFYVCLTVSAIELGVLPSSSQDHSKKAQAVLRPRRDHVLRQLSRIGLKVKQMETTDLIKLYYDIYNPFERYGSDAQVKIISTPGFVSQQTANQPPPSSPASPTPLLTPQPKPTPKLTVSYQPPPNMPKVLQTPSSPLPGITHFPMGSNLSSSYSTPPFVVEELPDEFGS